MTSPWCEVVDGILQISNWEFGISMVVLHMFDFLEPMDPLQSWQKNGILFL